MQNPDLVQAQARTQVRDPKTHPPAPSARSSSRSLRPSKSPHATSATSSLLASSTPSRALQAPCAPRSSELAPVRRVERVEVLLAAADVKGGLGTGGNRVMGATVGAVARAVARVEGLEGEEREVEREVLA